jgi:hypothetical protein
MLPLLMPCHAIFASPPLSASDVAAAAVFACRLFSPPDIFSPPLRYCHFADYCHYATLAAAIRRHFR